MISANQLIGSVVFRTREALAANSVFIAGLGKYPYAVNCFTDGKFNFWHYPGTFNEISGALLEASKHKNGAKLKFPSLLSFHPVRQTVGKDRIVEYKLAFIAKTNKDWDTPDREAYLFDPLLRPLYTEFINQLKVYFNIEYNGPAHDYYEVFTTGSNKGVLVNIYGDEIDAVELHHLRLTVKNICDAKVISAINEHNALVTERFIETIKKQ